MADLRDQDSLAGRVKRYARVSTAVGGVASRLLGARLFGTGHDRGETAAELGRVLGGLKGPVMKVAQMLATIPDALPSEYVAAFAVEVGFAAEDFFELGHDDGVHGVVDVDAQCSDGIFGPDSGDAAWAD